MAIFQVFIDFQTIYWDGPPAYRGNIYSLDALRNIWGPNLPLAPKGKFKANHAVEIAGYGTNFGVDYWSDWLVLAMIPNLASLFCATSRSQKKERTITTSYASAVSFMSHLSAGEELMGQQSRTGTERLL